jgi:co-chaperonin GroES (HSP10)
MAVKGTLRPLRDKIFVSNMNFGESKTKSGIVLTADDGKSSGLHPRWGKVLFVGDEQKDIKPGQWILIQHGRWTRYIEYETDNGEIIKIHMVDNEGILGYQDDEPEEDGVRMSIGAMNFNIPGA